MHWLATALKSIPWKTIIVNAPKIAMAADTLLSGVRRPKPDLAATNELHALSDRVTALEAHDQKDAELVKQLADQAQALTIASQVLAGRVRLMLILVIFAIVIAVAAIAVAIGR